jgi:hypothetical protein
MPYKELKQKIERLGSLYLSKEILQGDYYPVWLKNGGRNKVIDPEFCFMAYAN